MKKIGYETFWGGIFGGIAILTAIFSLIFGEFTVSAVADCVKDVAGTLVVVIVLFVAIKQLLPKKSGDFNGAFEAEMKTVIAKYEPLISRDEKYFNEGKIMYRIVPNFDAIFGEKPQAAVKLFDFDGHQTLNFSVTKTIFVGKGGEDFTQQDKIIGDITHKIRSMFLEKMECFQQKEGFSIRFNEPLINEEDAALIAQVIDIVIFYYIAENKK